MSLGVNADNISEIFQERSHQSRADRELVCYACACLQKYYRAAEPSSPVQGLVGGPSKHVSGLWDGITSTQRSKRDKPSYAYEGHKSSSPGLSKMSGCRLGSPTLGSTLG